MGNKRKLVYLLGTLAVLASASLAQAQIPSNFARGQEHIRQQSAQQQYASPSNQSTQTFYQSQRQPQSYSQHSAQSATYLDRIPSNVQYSGGSGPQARIARAQTGQGRIAPRRSFGARPRGFRNIGFRARQDGAPQEASPFGEAPAGPQGSDPFADSPRSVQDPFDNEQVAPGEQIAPGGENEKQLSDPFADPPGLAPPAQDNRTREPEPRQPQTGGGADPVLPRDANPDLDRNPNGGSVLEGNRPGDNPRGTVPPEDPNNDDDDQDDDDQDGEDPIKDPRNERNFDEDRYIPPAGVYRPPRRRRPLDYQDPYQQPGYQQELGYQQQQGYQQQGPGYQQQPGSQQPYYQPQYQQPGYQPQQQQVYQPAYQPIPGHAPIPSPPPAYQPTFVPPLTQQLVTSPPAQQFSNTPSTAQQFAITPPTAQQFATTLPSAQQLATSPQPIGASPANNVYTAAVAPLRSSQGRAPNFYFSFFGGWSDVGELVSETGLGQFNLDDGTVFGIALGRRNGRNLRTELEFSTRSNDVSSFTDGSALTPLSGNDVTSYGGMANAYWEFERFRTRLFQPYIGVGVGFISIDSDIVDSNSQSIVEPDTDNDTSLAFQYMAGVNYKAYRNVDLFAEYRFLRADTFRLDTTVGTSDRYNYRNDNVFLGLRWKF